MYLSLFMQYQNLLNLASACRPPNDEVLARISFPAGCGRQAYTTFHADRPGKHLAFLRVGNLTSERQWQSLETASTRRFSKVSRHFELREF